MPDIRLGGLLTGMDVQGTIDKILALKSKSVTSLEEKKISLQADVAAWSDIGGVMQNLTDALYSMRSYDTWNKQTALSSDIARLTATATGTAAAATYDISISKLAQAHSVSTDSLSALGLGSSTDTLVGTVSGLADGDQFDIQGQTITIEASDTMASLLIKINDASASMAASDKVTASIIADRLVITRDLTGSSEISMSDTVGTALIDLGVLQSVTQKPQPPSGNTLWLEMTGNSSPSVIDSSVYGNNGTEVSGAVWDPSGQFDGAYTLNGTTDAIQVPQSPENDGYDTFTWSVWVNTTRSSRTIMHYGDRADSAGITIDMAANGRARAYIDDGSTQVSVTGSTDISDGVWHLVTVTDDGSTLKLYIDGNATPEATANSTGVGYITTNDHDVIDVGRLWNNGGYSAYFEGYVDEVMVFNRDLSAAEVGALYSPTTTISYKNELAAAQDAEFTVNGASVVRSENTDLTDVISGVSLNLKGAASSITLEIAQDTETPKAAIQELITSYNAAVEKLQSYININIDDPKNPVVGELQGDTLVGSILYNLRRLVTASKSEYMTAANAAYSYGGNTGVMESLEDVGVWTMGKDNELSITDETKLDYMLQNYFDEVEQLFRGVAGGSGYEHGVAEDLYDYSYSVSETLTGQIDTRKNSIEKQVSRYSEKIERMYNELDDYEDSLWAQFGAMEESVAKLQSQTSWLVGQLGMENKG